MIITPEILEMQRLKRNNVEDELKQWNVGHLSNNDKERLTKKKIDEQMRLRNQTVEHFQALQPVRMETFTEIQQRTEAHNSDEGPKAALAQVQEAAEKQK